MSDIYVVGTERAEVAPRAPATEGPFGWAPTVAHAPLRCESQYPAEGYGSVPTTGRKHRFPEMELTEAVAASVGLLCHGQASRLPWGYAFCAY